MVATEHKQETSYLPLSLGFTAVPCLTSPQVHRTVWHLQTLCPLLRKLGTQGGAEVSPVSFLGVGVALGSEGESQTTPDGSYRAQLPSTASFWPSHPILKASLWPVVCPKEFGVFTLVECMYVHV